MKILVLGPGRHGKDTVAEYLATKLNLAFASSSHFLCEKIIFPVLAPKLGYKDIEECYQDRVNHRQTWMDLIREYNSSDKARLTREILAQNDIYVGMRDAAEFAASRHLFDMIIEVSAHYRIETPDPTYTIHLPIHEDWTSSNLIIRIDNNAGLPELYRQLDAIVTSFPVLKRKAKWLRMKGRWLRVKQKLSNMFGGRPMKLLSKLPTKIQGKHPFGLYEDQKGRH